MTNIITQWRVSANLSKKIQLIAPSNQLTNDIWQFWVEKLVFDVLDYCNRADFKMDDTSFKFNIGVTRTITNPDNKGLLSDSDFDSIKPRLNLYRKPVSW